jgi:recombination protein RecA
MVELNGLEGTGKSLIAAHILANTQKKGGIGVMIDTEASAAPEFWKAVGVEISNLPYIHLTTVEDIFENIEKMIGVVRKSTKDRLVTFVVDSVAAASTLTEMQSDHGKDGYATAKSIIISKAMRKMTNLIGSQRILVVFTNQLRMNMNVMAFGDKYVTSGGKAMAYHCSVRVRLNNTGKIKKKDEVVGNKCKAVVVKNRLGPPFRSAEFDIMFDSGAADLASWVKFMKDNGLAKGTGAYFTINGYDEKFNPKKFVDRINKDAEFKEAIYNSICEKYIMKYRDPNSKIEEELEYTEDDDE